jgi:membrane associated rhomboid family serine protease
MLESRDYMRRERPPTVPWQFEWSASLLLMVALVVAFVGQQASASYAGLTVDRYLALTANGLKAGFVWQLLTFQVLHASAWHLIFNLLGVWVFGRAVESHLGVKQFLWLYSGSGIAGGVLQSILSFSFPAQYGGPVYGASAGVCALVAAYCMMDPNAELRACFIRAKYFLMITLAGAVLLALAAPDKRIAYAADVGAMLAGMAWVRWGIGPRLFHWSPLKARQRERELVRAASIRGRPWRQGPLDQDSDMPSEEFIAREVDPILEKISAHGIQSLTERERRILEAARQRMVKR